MQDEFHLAMASMQPNRPHPRFDRVRCVPRTSSGAVPACGPDDRGREPLVMRTSPLEVYVIKTIFIERHGVRKAAAMKKAGIGPENRHVVYVMVAEPRGPN